MFSFSLISNDFWCLGGVQSATYFLGGVGGGGSAIYLNFNSICGLTSNNSSEEICMCKNFTIYIGTNNINGLLDYDHSFRSLCAR